jgi:hypothetical protein
LATLPGRRVRPRGGVALMATPRWMRSKQLWTPCAKRVEAKMARPAVLAGGGSALLSGYVFLDALQARVGWPLRQNLNLKLFALFLGEFTSRPGKDIVIEVERPAGSRAARVTLFSMG